jgi:hypothetical protein
MTEFQTQFHLIEDINQWLLIKPTDSVFFGEQRGQKYIISLLPHQSKQQKNCPKFRESIQGSLFT